MKRVFVEYPGFHKHTKSGNINDEQFKEIQRDIMQGLGEMIPGTGGIKKIRSASDLSGKRGGWRVIFADYPKYSVTLLLGAFPKGKKTDLKQWEVNEFKQLKKSLDRHVETYYG